MRFYEQLHYEDMWKEIAQRYIFDGARLWVRARNELGRTPAVRVVKRDIRRFALEYIKKHHLTKYQKLELMFLLNPSLKTLYQHGSRLKSKISNVSILTCR